jgi:hypothetical protein
MIAILICAGAAQAQAQSRRGDDRDDAKKQGRGPASAAEAKERASDQAFQQLNQARRAIRLTPAQEPLYDVFQERVLALMEDLNRGVPPTTVGDSAIKQIDRRVDLLRNRLAAFEDVSDAARRLYAALTPEQKETADRVLPGALPSMYQQTSPFRGDGAVRERNRQ